MCNQGEHIYATFKKGGAKRDSAIIQRSDGSEVFIQYRPSMVFHDLAHMAIESTLSIRAGFYWLVNLGLVPSDFELPKDQRPPLLIESLKNPDHIAIEYLANQLMVEATNSGPIDNFIEVFHQSMLQKEASTYTFQLNQDILKTIRDLYDSLLREWRLSPPATQKKIVVYYPIAQTV